MNHPSESNVSQAPFDAGSVGVTVTQYADLPEPLSLECGRSLYPVRIAYETYGSLSPTRDNVVVVCHALSGNAHAAGWSRDLSTHDALDEGTAGSSQGIRGWWDGMIGAGRAFDTERYFVICTNLIGGCDGSTGPSSTNPATGQSYGTDFPVITVGDMVEAQVELLRLLGIEQVVAVAGGSTGGMIAMEWSVRHPRMVRGCIPIASTSALGTQGVAWNAIARNAIMADPDWQGGHYYGTGRAPVRGIGVARMVGHVTYLSKQSMHRKFDRKLQDRDEYTYTLDTPDFQVESYLRHQGARFAARFDANTYLYFSRALTYFDLARTHGGGSLDSALSNVEAEYLLISFTSDWLYPPEDSERVARALRANGKSVVHHVIDSDYGHDAFLLDVPSMTPLIREFVRRVESRK